MACHYKKFMDQRGNLARANFLANSSQISEGLVTENKSLAKICKQNRKIVNEQLARD